MFSRKNPVQKVTTKSKFYPVVFPYFSYAASSRQSETYQNIHGRFLANLGSIYLRERRQKKDCWKFPSQSLHKHLENFSIKSLAFRRNIRGKRTLCSPQLFYGTLICNWKFRWILNIFPGLNLVNSNIRKLWN